MYVNQALAIVIRETDSKMVPTIVITVNRSTQRWTTISAVKYVCNKLGASGRDSGFETKSRTARGRECTFKTVLSPNVRAAKGIGSHLPMKVTKFAQVAQCWENRRGPLFSKF